MEEINLEYSQTFHGYLLGKHSADDFPVLVSGSCF